MAMSQDNQALIARHALLVAEYEKTQSEGTLERIYEIEDFLGLSREQILELTKRDDHEVATGS